jgi:phosphoglycolate phosphatase
MTRLVLFDIDGTLIQTGGAGMKAFDRAFELEFGVGDAAAGIDFSGRTDRGILKDFFLHHRLEPSEENHGRFFNAYVHWLDYYLTLQRGETLPGVLSLLRGMLGLPRRPVIGLLTGNIRLGAQIKLRHHCLWHFFETGAFGCEHHDRNQIARIALVRGQRFLGRLDGEQVLVIGDTTRDIDCAQAIGARSLAVATGGGDPDELRDRSPTWLVDDLSRVDLREICR